MTEEIQMFSDANAFELAQRVAKVFAASQMVPKQFQGDISNCMIAINIANRLGADPFAVMQNMYVVQGRPAFSASFMLAMVNASRRFTPLRFEYVGEQGSDEWACRVVSTERETGQDCIGSFVNIGLAKAEGWYGKNGSKWKTMPEQMLAYRAASFWARIYASDLLCGIVYTPEELHDSTTVQAHVVSKPSDSNPLDKLTETLTQTQEKPKQLPDAERNAIEQMWLEAVSRWGEKHSEKLSALCEELGVDLSKISLEGAYQVTDVIKDTK